MATPAHLHGYVSGYAVANGLRLHYLNWPGGTPPVLCLPGITANAHAFEGLAETLSPRRRVLAVDLRGRGLSDKPPGGYDVGTHVADVVGLLDGLGLASVVLVGWSLGAKVALAVAARSPERVERLVLLDPPVETPASAVAALRDFWARLDSTYTSVDELLSRVRASNRFKEWTPYVERYLRADVERAPNGRVRHLVPPRVPEAELAAESAYPTRSFYARVTCPTLILRSARPLARDGDQVLGSADAREMAAALRDARLVEIDDADHFSILLGKPPRTREAIEAFLDGEERGGNR